MKRINTEGKHSYEIEVPEKKNVGGVKRMPVYDVRDGKNHREKVEAILKEERSNNGSKFFKQSYSLLGYTYNSSPKKK